LFRELILARLTPDMVVLDLGAGAGIIDRMNFRGKAAKVCGVDLDPRVADNPYLDEARVADADGIPYGNEIFDLVFADNVMEHLEQPEAVFAEIARVLKPRGILLFKTPNRSHYVPLIARVTPHGFHQFVNRLRGRDAEDTFPTCYLANSASQVQALTRRTGFEVVALDRIEGRPEYLRMTAFTYLVGAAYERVVNLTPLLSRFRVLLVAELRKTGTAER
jgi:SAM-dependent methyltransferase